MPELPAKWEMEVFATLWLNFGQEPFTNYEAKHLINKPNLNQALSHLRKKGWLQAQRDQRDARKSHYTLNDPQEVITQLIEKYSKP